MSHYSHAITCTKGNTDDDTDDAGARSMSANIASYWYCSPNAHDAEVDAGLVVDT